MDAKLLKIKTIFNKIKDTRVHVVNVFSVLEVKLTKLKNMTNDFIKSNHDVLFVFGLDSFKFQSKLIDFEYAAMQKYFYALNNRMYCEYYKLFKIVSEYVDKTIGTNKTFEMIKTNSVFPIYKDLEPYKQYNFETIEEVHKTIILLLGGIQEHIVFKETELENYKIKQHSGLNINNFVNTFLFNVTMIKQNLGLFISYLDFFHNIHIKHFKRFAKKMKSMDDYLNEDITFDDSPRRKNSRDFDDTLSQISSVSSSSSGSGDDPVINQEFHEPIRPKAVPRKSDTTSMLKKGVNSVLNTFRVFNSGSTKPSTNNNTGNKIDNISDNISVTSHNSVTSHKSNNINLHIEEKGQTNNTIPVILEFNSTNLTRERSETISTQLQNDPKLMDKMFEQLTKTIDEPEVKMKEVNDIIDDNIDDNVNFGVEVIHDELIELAPVFSDIIGKKKETIDNTLTNILGENVKQGSYEYGAEDVINKNEVEEAIDPAPNFNKKKRGNKKK